MTLVEAEELAPVLKPEAEPERAEAASHAAEVALDEGYHVAVPIGRREIDGVPRPEERVAGLDLARRLSRIEELAAPRRLLEAGGR